MSEHLKRAFSLVELLVVMAIMITLLALVLPATGSLMRSMNIGRAAAMVGDELNFARQTALSRNRDVEVRFYKLGSKTDANDKKYRAVRIFLADGSDASKSQPLGKLKRLPETIVITDDAKFSTLLDYQNGNRSGLSQSNETVAGENAQYVTFLFRANGETSLKPVTPPLGNWFLTLYAENSPTNAGTGLPANYFTAQIDPVTGRMRSYRP